MRHTRLDPRAHDPGPTARGSRRATGNVLLPSRHVLGGSNSLPFAAWMDSCRMRPRSHRDARSRVRDCRNGIPSSRQTQDVDLVEAAGYSAGTDRIARTWPLNRPGTVGGADAT